jgi:hypothetical protein
MHDVPKRRCAPFARDLHPLNVFAGPFLRTDQAPPPQRSRNFANGADPGDYGRKIVLIVRTVLLEIMKIDLRAPARIVRAQCDAARAIPRICLQQSKAQIIEVLLG